MSSFWTWGSICTLNETFTCTLTAFSKLNIIPNSLRADITTHVSLSAVHIGPFTPNCLSWARTLVGTGSERWNKHQSHQMDITEVTQMLELLGSDAKVTRKHLTEQRLQNCLKYDRCLPGGPTMKELSRRGSCVDKALRWKIKNCRFKELQAGQCNWSVGKILENSKRQEPYHGHGGWMIFDRRGAWPDLCFRKISLAWRGIMDFGKGQNWRKGDHLKTAKLR